MPLHDERAIDGQAEPLRRRGAPVRPAGTASGDGRLQLRDARGRLWPAVRDDRRVVQEGAADQLADLQLDDLARRLVHEVALGQGDDAVAQAEQAEDFEVLARLRHDRIVGGDDEQGEVDAGGAGEHVLDEALVAGHVDDAEAEVAEVEAGEADVDGDAAGLFLGQAVAVDAGEGLDERGLAVVDVAGGAEDQVAWHVRSSGGYCSC